MILSLDRMLEYAAAREVMENNNREPCGNDKTSTLPM